MTKAERIEAMAQAMMAGNWYIAPEFAREHFRGFAHLAYDAADVEGMVRAGVIQGYNAATLAFSEGGRCESIDAIVGRVCGNE